MKQIISNIKNNWILYIIILQPILDIISFFQTKIIGTSYTWLIRIATIVCIFIITYLKSKNKRKLLLTLFPFALFFVIHILNLYRINELNILLDIKYFIQVFQLPVLTILLIDYIKNTNYDLVKIKKGIFINFIIITISVLISYITNTYETTYFGSGLIGWFSSANTQSMVLCALAPWFLYFSSNFKNVLFYILGCIVVFFMLYLNATKSCYITLLSLLFIMFIAFIFSKKEKNKKVKIIITFSFIIISLVTYKYSFTFTRKTELNQVSKDYAENIEEIVDPNNTNNETTEEIEPESFDYNNISDYDDATLSAILKTSYIFEYIMEIHGDKAVIDVMKPYLSPTNLSDNRLVKKMNAKIEYIQSDSITKSLGIGYSRIQEHELDMENDLQAIFYYYGYIGTLIYASFILYFIIKLAILFFKNFSIINDTEYIILGFLVILLIAGGEYSGAFLRKSNANIYLSLYFVLLYFKLEKELKKKNINNKKITFLLLHLGYGGIETSTINTANALSKKYDIELISFYNLKDNQAKYLNNNIQIKYLYNGGPNKEEFKRALKNKNIISIIKEGIKSIDILTKKKYLIKKEILNSDSFAMVSTRFEFSTLLSKHGRKEIIKIAQEHHHHNSNKKYIKILRNKYKKIDYLLALTNNLKNDYEKFLIKNKHTKIIVIPNMITSPLTKQAFLNTNNIITISRLHEGKRLNDLINIFSKLDNKNSLLYIIGDGDEEQNLKKQINALGLNKRVLMTGYLNKDEQTDYLLKSSVFAMTSISEGLPMVLLEAMQYGLPCIAYETDSGVSDIIRNNENGFIIKNRDENKYIEKLNTLLKDYDLRKSMRKNCIQTCENFNEDTISQLWFSILDKKN